MPRQSKPSWKGFRIYPNFPLSAKYFSVEVHRTHPGMLRAIERYGGGKEMRHPKVVAATLMFSKDPRRRKVGVLVFCKDSFTPDLITHEVSHAATYWALMYDRTCKDIYDDPDADELRAQVEERLVGQIFSNRD